MWIKHNSNKQAVLQLAGTLSTWFCEPCMPTKWEGWNHTLRAVVAISAGVRGATPL